MIEQSPPPPPSTLRQIGEWALQFAALALALYLLFLSLLVIWWSIWKMLGHPSSFTFGHPDGSLALNIFFAALLPTGFLMLGALLHPVAYVLNRSRLFLAPSTNAVFRGFVWLAILLLVGFAASIMVAADSWWYGLFPLPIAACLIPMAFRKARV